MPNKNRAREVSIMNKKGPNKILIGVILLFFSSVLLCARNIDPDVEIRIKGLVCPSCAIGLKNIFKRNFYVKELKMDTKKGRKKKSVIFGFWSRNRPKMFSVNQAKVTFRKIRITRRPAHYVQNLQETRAANRNLSFVRD